MIGVERAGSSDHSVTPRLPVLTARDLVKTYDSAGGSVHALRGVDFELARGDFVVLLGPSGSGKSTLLNLVGGLDRATSGRLLFGETDLAALDERALTLYLRRHVGFVFQSYNLIPSLTAGENVALGAIGTARALAPEEALALVGVGDLCDRFPAQLSGGEQQRVAVGVPSERHDRLARRRRLLSWVSPICTTAFRRSSRAASNSALPLRAPS